VEPIIVVGLGNPGTEYDCTRHNVGFKVIDELARRFKTPIRAGRGEYLLASRGISGKEVVLVKPLTYMNNSGIAVSELLDAYSARLDELMLVMDDLALPLGTIRVRAKGSGGGHNGLSSVIYHLNTNEFARIRCGIRRNIMPPKERMAEFVLSPFEQEERETVEVMIAEAADAVVEFATAGIARTMNKVNTRL
jgi:PTH1 family peptidyl-tRNA hydrolase